MEITVDNKNRMFTHPVFIFFTAMLCNALWGSATPFIKIGYELILPDKDVPSTILFAGIRFTLAGIITVLIYSIARRKFLFPRKESLSKVATVSCFQTVLQYVFFYIGLANTTGVKGTIASGSSVFFAIFISALVFKQEKLTLKKVAAGIIGFIGVIAVNLNGLTLSFNLLGDGFVLFAAISYAISSVLMKRFSGSEDPVVISGYQFILGGAVMVAIGLSLGGSVYLGDIKGVGVLLYLAVLSAVAYSLWGILLKHNPVSKISVYTFMTPVFGVLLSSLMLTEDSGVELVNLILALVLVAAGIFMLNYSPKSKNN